MKARLWRTVGAGAVGVAALGLAAACDSGPVSTFTGQGLTPDGSSARPFTAVWLQREITDGDAQSFGPSATKATCHNDRVDETGVGTYVCQVLFSDGQRELDAVITVFPDGTWQEN